MFTTVERVQLAGCVVLSNDEMELRLAVLLLQGEDHVVGQVGVPALYRLPQCRAALAQFQQ